jgi:hypothetical protein
MYINTLSCIFKMFNYRHEEYMTSNYGLFKNKKSKKIIKKTSTSMIEGSFGKTVFQDLSFVIVTKGFVVITICLCFFGFPFLPFFQSERLGLALRGK